MRFSPNITVFVLVALSLICMYAGVAPQIAPSRPAKVDLAPTSIVSHAPNPVRLYPVDPTIPYFPWRCRGLDLGAMGKSRVITSLLVSEDNAYIHGARVLGGSLVKHVDLSDVELLLMVLDDVVLSPASISLINQAGWTICPVQLIESGYQDEVLPRFRKIFVKLAPFTWMEFKRFIFMDLDTMVFGNLTALLSPDESGSGCAFDATLDYADGHFRKTFNSGVFASCPSLEIFDFFMRFIKVRNDYDIIMGDQGILNKMAEEGVLKVRHIPMELNANLAIYLQDRALWTQHVTDIQVIHYTMAKPFNLIGNPQADEMKWQPIQLWFQEYKRLLPLPLPSNTRKQAADAAIARFMDDSNRSHGWNCVARTYGSGRGSHTLCDKRPPKPCVFYSFGISDNYSFDEDIAKLMGCTGIALDPTVDYPEFIVPGVRFMKVGARIRGPPAINIDVPEAPTTWPETSVTELMKTYGHVSLAVLKMDCEGCEFVIAEDVERNDPDLFTRVDQFAFEIHLANAFMPTEEHYIALGDLFSLLYKSGHVMMKHDIYGCNVAHEDTGCHPHLLALGYPCGRQQMCQNVLFAKP